MELLMKGFWNSIKLRTLYGEVVNANVTQHLLICNARVRWFVDIVPRDFLPQ